MIAIVQVVDSNGAHNTVSVELGDENDTEVVMTQIESGFHGFSILLVSVVAEVNGKLMTYAMRRYNGGLIKVFNRTPLKLDSMV